MDLEKIFVELQTPEGKKIAVDIAEIESVVELDPIYQINGERISYADLQIRYGGRYEGESRIDRCQINMKSGDKGKVGATYSELIEHILNAASGVESV